MSERPEEPKVTDPSVSGEPDMRLTIREWVIFWKTKHDMMLVRFQDLADLTRKQRDMMKDQTITLGKVNDRCRDLEANLHVFQEERQAAAKKEGGVPEASGGDCGVKPSKTRGRLRGT